MDIKDNPKLHELLVQQGKDAHEHVKANPDYSQHELHFTVDTEKHGK